MKTLIIPKFNNQLQLTGYTEVKIKNKPDTADYNKVHQQLPGLPMGYCEELYTIGKTKRPIPIINFYDSRQRANKLKNFFIALKQ